MKDSTLNNSDVLPQSNMQDDLKNLYPSKIILELDLYSNKKYENDSINPDLLFVRSAFSESSQIFKRINSDYTKGMLLKITEDFGAYIDAEYWFNMFALNWKTMPKSDIATVIKRIKKTIKQSLSENKSFLSGFSTQKQLFIKNCSLTLQKLKKILILRHLNIHTDVQ
ncbi:MAG: hypothetical protein LBS69_01050 [Prevotellaceae bacterium]|nr:hypothetical protein [Prevotellaceae bacterium]